MRSTKLSWQDGRVERETEFLVWTRAEKKAEFGLGEPKGLDGFDLFTAEDWNEGSLATQAATKVGIEQGASFWCGYRFMS